MNRVEEKEPLSLLDLKGKFLLSDDTNMVEHSFDLDEKICQMLEEMAKDENKSESEIVQEAIMDYSMARIKSRGVDDE